MTVSTTEEPRPEAKRNSSTTTTELEARIEQLERPYRDEEVLRSCYYEQKLSLNETAEKLGVECPKTISYWMEKHGLDRRDRLEALKEDEFRPSFTDAGYMVFVSSSNGEQNTVTGHQVLACLNDDPHEVFADNTHVHHKIGTTIDFPGNLEVLTVKEHHRKHVEDEVLSPDIDDLFPRTDGERQ